MMEMGNLDANFRGCFRLFQRVALGGVSLWFVFIKADVCNLNIDLGVF
jgi:hypothetical protein